MDNRLINRVKVYIMCFLHTMMFYFSISRVCLKAMQCDATFGALYSFTNTVFLLYLPSALPLQKADGMRLRVLRVQLL